MGPMNGTKPPSPPKQPPANRLASLPPRQYWLFFLLILFVNWLVMSFLFPSEDTPVTVPYTVFREEVARGNVNSIYSRNTSIEGRFKAAVTWPKPGQ